MANCKGVKPQRKLLRPMALNKTQQKATFRNTCEVKKVEILKIKRERQMHNGVPPTPTTTRYNVLSVKLVLGLRDWRLYYFFGRIHLTQRRCIPNEQRRNEIKDTLQGPGLGYHLKKNRRVAWRCPFCNTGGKHPVATSYCK